jgi:hypothetical protein
MAASLDISPDDQPGTGGGRESAAERRDRWDDRTPFRAPTGEPLTATPTSRTAADPSSRLDVVV